MQSSPAPSGPWYQGVTRYQWMVLAIAAAGWVFDVFEGQLFGSLMSKFRPALLEAGGLMDYKELFFYVWIGAFLAGGAVGGVAFGILADRWGRQRTMAITILVYSLFTGLTALVDNWWQLAVLRFLVGLGVGGEWAVAAAVVAEIFPPRARPVASGIFHASSVLGTYLAVGVGLFVSVLDEAYGWRIGFLVGILPALLVLWVRVSMREPESWQMARQRAAQESTQGLGNVSELFAAGPLRRYTLLATALAVVGLATFWGTHFRGKDVLRASYKRQQETAQVMPRLGANTLGLLGSPFTGPLLAASSAPSVADFSLDKKGLDRYEMLGMFLVTTGGGIGLLSFAPLSQRLGRRGAFVLFHCGGFALTAAVYVLANSAIALLIALPVFGFFTLGMHAGYAVYFPELFPTRLRSTGAGFCFNMARVVVVPVLLLFAWLQDGPLKLGLALAMLVLGSLFLLGLVLVWFCPETRGQPLPE